MESNVKLQMPNKNDDPSRLKLKDIMGSNHIWKGKDMEKVKFVLDMFLTKIEVLF